MEVFIPSFRYEESELERGYTVFKIEVLMNGRKHFVEKRYSEFHALHKKLKKFIRTPEIPSKHVRNWVPKVLEQRRQGLELYLQPSQQNELELWEIPYRAKKKWKCYYSHQQLTPTISNAHSEVHHCFVTFFPMCITQSCVLLPYLVTTYLSLKGSCNNLSLLSLL
ncbi:sorting nexin-24 isoform X2 [Catharus ustulatus]|uniref:sorting nexin-24 isoform X2 n=1 Tax=Catharus ustulatus TaxID=91951 RepID=UPI00140CE05D|nr:sorting nexin-24 isoform X2 [Catharus ustulatus]